MTLGQKIKTYRKKAGLSQMDLELAIGASPGAISRIENGIVNPQKETILKISKSLNLRTSEINHILGLEPSQNKELVLDLVFEVISLQVLNKYGIKETVDEIIKKIIELGFLFPTLYLLDKNKKFLQIQNSSIPKLALDIGNKILGNVFNFKFEIEKDNVLAKAVKSAKMQRANSIHELLKPFVGELDSRLIEKVLSVKSILVVPLVINGICIGCVSIGKNEEFSENDIETIKAYCERVTLVILNSIRSSMDLGLNYLKEITK